MPRNQPLFVHQSDLPTHKTKLDKKLAYMTTRLADTNGIKETWRFKTNIGKQCFMARTVSKWNSLPSDVYSIFTLAKFKDKFSPWVKQKFPQ